MALVVSVCAAVSLGRRVAGSLGHAAPSLVTMTSTPPSSAPSSAPSPVPALPPPPPPPVPGAAPAPAANVWRRGLTRLSGGPGRLAGLDVARGLAVLGMFVAHVYTPDPITGADPVTWAWVFDGRSSILFATLAGVSLALLSGRSHPLEGVPALQARMRILVRALLIFVLGEILTMLGTPVAVILQVYAVLFVLALPFLRWTARGLFVLAGASAVVLPFLTPLVAATLTWSELGFVPLTELFVTGTYPAMIWFTFVVLGLAIGRCDLVSARVQLLLLAAGTGAAALAYSLAAVAGPVDPGASMAATLEDGSAPVFVLPDLAAVARTAEAHSGGLAEVIGSGAFAMAVIAACLLTERWLRWVLVPVAAVGSMALTAYTAHLLVLWRIGEDYWHLTGLTLLVPFVGTALVGCTLWRFFLGRGPLERLLTWASWRAAASIAPAPHQMRR